MSKIGAKERKPIAKPTHSETHGVGLAKFMKGLHGSRQVPEGADPFSLHMPILSYIFFPSSKAQSNPMH
jgi:hypothetical protein